MFDSPVVFVDVETTGGGYRTSRVLEVAAIRYENGEVTDEFTSLVNPETYVPEFITGITGITNADIEFAPKFKDISGRLGEILSDAIFVAHNVNFDYSFIKSEFSRAGIPYNSRKLCTVRLSRKLYPGVKGHRLEDVINRHSIPFSARHRAMDDTRAMLYFAQLAHAEHGAELFREAVQHQLKSQFAAVNIEPELVQEIESSPGVYVFKDGGGTVLYVGKSVDMRKRVKSHFQNPNPKEVKLAQATERVETIPTGSELLALMLESRLVKKLSPIFNRQLRRTTKYCMVVRSINDQGYPQMRFVQGNPGDVYHLSDIYALYENTYKAKRWVDVHSRTFSLCPKLMGIEKTSGACFWYALKKCRGACIGEETPEAYTARLDAAFARSRFMDWPYEGPVSVIDKKSTTELKVDRWIVTGIEGQGSSLFQEQLNAFDLDEYKILKQYLLGSKHADVLVS